MSKREMCFDNHALLPIPCKRDCPNRTPFCHGDCEKYKEYRKKLNALEYGKEEERRDKAFGWKEY